MENKIYKFSQSTKETLLKAQKGDENVIAQVIEENMGLITHELTKWGYAPKTEDFEDTLSDIKVEMIQKVIPQWDPKRGAFSTFLTWAIHNFLRRGTRKKKYEEQQKEISITEPIEEELTLEDTLAQPSSVLDHATLSNARENLQNWIHLKNPELENIVLRIFDLKTSGEYPHDQIADILNSEGLSKGKPISRFMINNYVNDWIKPFIQQYLGSFKSASLSMRKKVAFEIEGTTYTTEDVNEYLEKKHGFTLSEFSKRINHLAKYIAAKIESGEYFEDAIDSWCKETGNGHPDFRY